jgi:hypothetical protein
MLYSGVPALLLEGSPHFSSDLRGAPYFRMDVRIEKRWTMGQNGWWAINGEVLNATSTREVVRLDCGSVCVERFSGPIVLPASVSRPDSTRPTPTRRRTRGRRKLSSSTVICVNIGN